MAIGPAAFPMTEVDYPTSDGRPMAETDLHRDLMFDLIRMLQRWFAADRMVYVSGNLLVYYEPGNRRRHLAPDVFVVKGVPNHKRDNYLIWHEAKGLDLVIELTSSSTREEDEDDKMWLYRDVLRVAEYFLFDPRGDYQHPRLRGFRLQNGEYVPIEPVNGRLPSEVLGLHLEADGNQLRLWDPKTGCWLPTTEELNQSQEEALKQKEAQAQQQAEALKQKEAQAQQQAEALKQKDSETAQERAARIQAELERDREAEARRAAEDELAKLREALRRFEKQ